MNVPERSWNLWKTAVASSVPDLFHEKTSRIEFNRQDAPRQTRGMKILMEDLRLDELWIVYPGTREHNLAPGVTLKPLTALV